MKTAAVIVTYNPDEGITERVKAIGRECAPVIIIDNGSTPDSLKGVKATIIRLGKNTGIAHAQNVGLKLAFEKGADGAILFDHDSTPQRGFTSALWTAYKSESHPVIVGAQIFDIHTRHFSKYPVPAGMLFRRRVCPQTGTLRGAMLAIASGCLVSRAVFEKVGGMREEFFIDYVDWEFCLRAWHAYGIQTIICGNAVLEHARGERKGKKLLGFTVHPPGYSLFRYQHMYRNRARLFREYFFRVPGFIAFEIIACSRDTLLLFFETQPFTKFCSAVLSWFHGFFGIRPKT